MANDLTKSIEQAVFDITGSDISQITSIEEAGVSSSVESIIVDDSTVIAAIDNNASEIAAIISAVSPVFELSVEENPIEAILFMYLGRFDIDPVDADVTGGLLNGHLYYNNTLNLLRIYDGTAPGWESLSCGICPQATSSEYCPGYSYTFVNGSTFQVIGFDVTNLFSPTRYLKFTVNGVVIYGEVVSSTYSGTETTVNMAMDSTLLSGTINSACLVAGNSGWSPIAEDPFNGSSINSIKSGKIGTQVYWIICGDAGKLAYSINAGLNWTNISTGTTENLNAIAYDSTNQGFMVVGDKAIVLTSTDALNWTLDTTVLAAKVISGIGNAIDVAFDHQENWFGVLFYRTSAGTYLAYTNDYGSSYIGTTGISGSRVTTGVYTAAGDVRDYYAIGDDVYRSNSFNITISSDFPFTDGDTVDSIYVDYTNDLTRIVGKRSGKITVNVTATATDTVTFTSSVREFAFSALLNRYIAVGDTAQIGYLEYADRGVSNGWTAVSNGLEPTANFTSVEYSEEPANQLFIAVADNGQILRSTNGVD